MFTFKKMILLRLPTMEQVQSMLTHQAILYKPQTSPPEEYFCELTLHDSHNWYAQK